MKLLVGAGTLAGTLGILMMLGMFPTPAYANIFLIDNFTDDDLDAPLKGTCDNSRTVGTSGLLVQTGLSEVIDMIRECQLTILVPMAPAEAMITVDESFAAGQFLQEAGDGVESLVLLLYDGEVMPASGRSLGLNLMDSDFLRISYTRADFQVNVTATLIDSGGDSASLEGILVAGTNTPKNLDFLLTAFEVANPAFSLTDVDELNFEFATPDDATDWTVNAIHITMSPVGGSMMPAETTALLLAGAELNAIWILPAIAAIGIGAFVVLRKR